MGVITAVIRECCTIRKTQTVAWDAYASTTRLGSVAELFAASQCCAGEMGKAQLVDAGDISLQPRKHTRTAQNAQLSAGQLARPLH